MAGPAQQDMGRSRRPPSAVGYAVALMAVAITAAASSPSASAQDGWAPVVVAVAPPEPRYLPDAPAPQPRPRPALRTTISDSPPLQREGLPPLTVIAAQTAATPQARRSTADPPDGDPQLAREYCLNIADAAADARLAWQKKVLADIEQEIAKRVEQLEAKTAEYQRWLARRDEFSKKAQASVVTIYARMRPDAAAAQLVAMDEETAAAVLVKLDPRNASAILNEMEATQAARLTATMSGAANVNLPGRPKAQPGDKRS